MVQKYLVVTNKFNVKHAPTEAKSNSKTWHSQLFMVWPEPTF